jgi:multidrug transporter EmrE-like cation transporter
LQQKEETMNAISLGLVLAGVVLNALAQSLLKAGANRLGPDPWASHGWAVALRVLEQWPFLLGFFCYGASLIIWIVALTRVPVTVAYPMLSIGYILNALIAQQWLGEQINGSGWAGIGLICMGVVLIARNA